jgi:hypothetical protein
VAIELSGMIFFLPVALGAILIVLGLTLKRRDNDVSTYGVVLGIGAAIILGWLGVLAVMLLPSTSH